MMNMQAILRAAAILLLPGCIILSAAGFGSTEERLTCGTEPRLHFGVKKTAAAQPDIAICKAAQDYKIINTGNVKLTNVRMTDHKGSAAVSCQQDALEAGESMTCAASKMAGKGCAVADHVVISEAGMMVTTKGDCADETTEL